MVASQEILIKISAFIRDHLTQQKARSVIGIGDAEKCRYRQPGSTSKCAVGCVLFDDLYDEKFENKTVSSIVLAQQLSGSECPEHQERGRILGRFKHALLKSLQLRGFEVTEWSEELSGLLTGWQIYHDATTMNCRPMYNRWLESLKEGEEKTEDSPAEAHARYVAEFV